MVRKKEEEELKDPLGILQPVKQFPSPRGPELSDPLGILEPVFPHKFVDPQPPPELPSLEPPGWQLPAARDVGEGVLEQLRNLLQIPGSDDPRGRFQRQAGSYAPPGPGLQFPEGAGPPAGPRFEGWPAEWEPPTEMVETPPRDVLAGGRATTGQELRLPGPGTPEGVRGRDTTMHTPTGVEQNLGYFLGGAAQTVGIKDPDYQAPETIAGKVLEFTGGIAPYVLAAKAVGPLAPLVSGALTKYGAGTGLAQVAGSVAARAATGATVAGVREGMIQLNPEEEKAVNDSLKSIAADTGRWAAFGAIRGAVGKPVADRLYNGISDSWLQGKLTANLANALTRGVGGGASGATLGALEIFLNWLHNPEEFDAATARNDILGKTLFFAGFDFFLAMTNAINKPTPWKALKWREDTQIKWRFDADGNVDVRMPATTNPKVIAARQLWMADTSAKGASAPPWQRMITEYKGFIDPHKGVSEVNRSKVQAAKEKMLGKHQELVRKPITEEQARGIAQRERAAMTEVGGEGPVQYVEPTPVKQTALDKLVSGLSKKIPALEKFKKPTEVGALVDPQQAARQVQVSPGQQVPRGAPRGALVTTDQLIKNWDALPGKKMTAEKLATLKSPSDVYNSIAEGFKVPLEKIQEFPGLLEAISLTVSSRILSGEDTAVAEQVQEELVEAERAVETERDTEPTTIPLDEDREAVVPSWSPGQTVYHDTFGEGQIQEVGKETLTINFAEHGTKKVVEDKISPTAPEEVAAPEVAAPPAPPIPAEAVEPVEKKPSKLVQEERAYRAALKGTPSTVRKLEETPKPEVVPEDPSKVIAEAEEQLKDVEAPPKHGTIEGKPVVTNMVVEDKKGNHYVVTKPREDGFVTVATMDGKLRTFKVDNLKLPAEDAPTEGLPFARDVKAPEEPVKKSVKKTPVKKKEEPKKTVVFKLAEGKDKRVLSEWELDKEDVETLEKVLDHEWSALSPAVQKMRLKLLNNLRIGPDLREPMTAEELVEWDKVGKRTPSKVDLDVNLHPDSFRMTLQMLNHIVDNFFGSHEFMDRTGKLVKVVDSEWFTKTGYMMESLGRDAHMLISGVTAHSVAQQKQELQEAYIRFNKLRSKILDAAEKMPEERYEKIMKGIAVAQRATPDDIIIKSRTSVKPKDLIVDEDDNPFDPVADAKQYASRLTPEQLAQQHHLIELRDASDKSKVILQVIKRRHEKTPWVVMDVVNNQILAYTSSIEGVSRKIEEMQQDWSDNKPSKKFNQAFKALKKSLKQSEKLNLAKDFDLVGDSIVKDEANKTRRTAARAFREAKLLPFEEKLSHEVTPTILPDYVKDQIARELGQAVPAIGEDLLDPLAQMDLDDLTPMEAEERLALMDIDDEKTRQRIKRLLALSDDEVIVEELMGSLGIIRRGAQEINVGDITPLKQKRVIELFNKVPGALEFWGVFLDGERGKVIVPRNLKGVLHDLTAAIGYRYNGNPGVFKTEDRLLHRAEAYYKHFLHPGYNEKEAQVRGEDLLEMLSLIKKNEWKLTEFDFIAELRRREGITETPEMKTRWKKHWNRTGGRPLPVESATMKTATDIAHEKKIPVEEAKELVGDLDKQFHPFHIRGGLEEAKLTDKLDKYLQDREVDEADRVLMVYNLTSMMTQAKEAGIDINFSFRIAPQIERHMEKELYEAMGLTQAQLTKGKVAVKRDGKLFDISMQLLLSSNEPLIESFFHEMAHVWLAVWEASGSKDYVKLKEHLTDELIKVLGFETVIGAEAEVDNWSNEEMASVLTDYLLAGGHAIDAKKLEAGEVNELQAWAGRFKGWVSEVVKRLQTWWKQNWPGQPEYFKEQARRFSEGRWEEAFKNMKDKPFAGVYFMSKPVGTSLNSILRQHAKRYGMEEALKFPTPFEKFSEKQLENVKKWQSDLAQIVRNKDLRPEYRKEIASILDQLNWRALTVSDKKLAKIANMKNFLKENTDWVMPPRWLEQLEVLERRPLGDLSYEEIELIFKTVSSFAEASKKKNVMKRERRQKEKEKLHLSIRTAVEKAHDLKVEFDKNMNRIVTRVGEKGWLPKTIEQALPGPTGRYVRKVLGVASLMPELIAQILQGSEEGPLKRIVYDNIMEGFNRKFDHYYQARDTMVNALKNKLGKNWAKKVRPWSAKFNTSLEDTKLIEHKLPSGETITLTPAERMSIYLHSKTDLGFFHLTEGGFQLPRESNKIKTYSVTAQDIGYIIQEMSPEEKAIADVGFMFLNTIQKDSVNKTAYERESFNLIVGDNFWPRFFSKIQMNVEEKKLAKSELRRAKGIISRTAMHLAEAEENERTPKTLYLRDFFDAFHLTVNDASTFIGLAAPLQDLHDLLQDKGFHDDLVAAGLSHWHESLKTYAWDMVKSIDDASDTERFVQHRLNNIHGSLLGASPFVVLKQPASYMLAIEELGAKYLIAGASRKADWDIIKKYQSSSMRYRGEGKITRETGEVGEVGASLFFFTEKSFMPFKFTEPIRKADAVAVGKLWNAVEEYIKDTQPKLKGDDFYRAVAKKWEEIVNRTQPTYLPPTRSEIGRSHSVFVRGFTAFTTQRNKTLNVTARAIWKYSISKKTPADMNKLLAVLIASIFAVPVWMVGVESFRDWVLRRPQKKWPEQVNRGVLNLISHVYFLGPAAQSAWSKHERGVWSGFDMMSPFTSTVNTGIGALGATISLLDQIAKGEVYDSGVREGQLKAPQTLNTLINETLKFWGLWTGVPMNNMMQLLEAQLSRVSPEMEFALYTRTRNPQVGYYYSHLWEWLGRANEKEAERAMRILVRHFDVDIPGLERSWKARDLTREEWRKALALYREVKRKGR